MTHDFLNFWYGQHSVYIGRCSDQRTHKHYEGTKIISDQCTLLNNTTLNKRIPNENFAVKNQ